MTVDLVHSVGRNGDGSEVRDLKDMQSWYSRLALVLH